MAFLRVGKCLLKQRLRESGLMQYELADRINQSPQMVNHYANNRKPMSLEIAVNIAKVLGCSVQELYEWDRC